jgi:hypothetical protein
MLNILPESLLFDLEKALESLEQQCIESVIKRIGLQDQTLKTKLASLAKNYNYPAILKVLKKKLK